MSANNPIQEHVLGWGVYGCLAGPCGADWLTRVGLAVKDSVVVVWCWVGGGERAYQQVIYLSSS